MKFITKKTEQLALFIMTMLFSVVAFAQNSTPDMNVDVTRTTTTTEVWYGNPLYWVIGAVLLIALIALARRGNKRN